MSPRERWLAAVRSQPVDRLPFWPKLGPAYGQAQRGAFAGWDATRLHPWIGSDCHEWLGAGTRDVRPRTRVDVQEADGQRAVSFVTLQGILRRVEHYAPDSCSWHPTLFPVQTVADVRAMTAFYEDCRVELDPAALDHARAAARALGENAVTATGIGESPFMEFIEHLAGVAGAHLLLADYPDEVTALLAAMHRVLRQRAELVLAHTPADLAYLVENTSTTLLSPAQYRAHCLPFIREYADLARAHGRLLVLHMCGHLRALLPDLATLPVAAFEAFTSPPVSNTRLADGRSACPEVCLIGGTNAVLWLQPAAAIIAELERDLAVLPHHRGLVITSAGVMPPAATPATIRTVCRWVQNYPCHC